MAYRKDIYDCSGSREIEIKFLGRYGGRGEKRAPKHKSTPYMVKLNNQRNREKEVRRLLKVNFCKDDLWCTLKYKKGYRPDLDIVKKDLKNFFMNLRRKYRKVGVPLKYIYRLEIGKYGGVHVHLVVNAVGDNPDLLVSRSWTAVQGAGVYWTRMQDSGTYAALAHYIVKEPDYETNEQLSLFDYEIRKHFVKYSRSRNLIQPKLTSKEIKRNTVRNLILNGIKPDKGYEIDKNSVRIGVNPFTGYSYIHYTENKIKDGEAPPGRYRPETFAGW